MIVLDVFQNDNRGNLEIAIQEDRHFKAHLENITGFLEEILNSNRFNSSQAGV